MQESWTFDVREMWAGPLPETGRPPAPGGDIPEIIQSSADAVQAQPGEVSMIMISIANPPLEIVIAFGDTA